MYACGTATSLSDSNKLSSCSPESHARRRRHWDSHFLNLHKCKQIVVAPEAPVNTNFIEALSGNKDLTKSVVH